jgi:hypothetical protein
MKKNRILYIALLFIVGSCSNEMTVEEIKTANKNRLMNAPGFITQSFELYTSQNEERKEYCIDQYLSLQLEQNAYFDSSAARIIFFILKRPQDTTRYESAMHWSPDTNYVISDRTIPTANSPFSVGMKQADDAFKKITPLMDSIVHKKDSIVETGF